MTYDFFLFRPLAGLSVADSAAQIVGNEKIGVLTEADFIQQKRRLFEELQRLNSEIEARAQKGDPAIEFLDRENDILIHVSDNQIAVMLTVRAVNVNELWQQLADYLALLHEVTGYAIYDATAENEVLVDEEGHIELDTDHYDELFKGRDSVLKSGDPSSNRQLLMLLMFGLMSLPALFKFIQC